MFDTMVLESTNVSSVQTWCGHVTYLPTHNLTIYKRNHKRFYCTTCGKGQSFGGESDIEQLRAKLITIEDQRDTARRNLQQQREKTRHKTRQLSAQKGVTTRIKNRIGNGVCPCCNRTFKNLARHMSGQHPDYKNVRKRNSKKQ